MDGEEGKKSKSLRHSATGSSSTTKGKLHVQALVRHENDAEDFLSNEARRKHRKIAAYPDDLGLNETILIEILC